MLIVGSLQHAAFLLLLLLRLHLGEGLTDGIGVTPMPTTMRRRQQRRDHPSCHHCNCLPPATLSPGFLPTPLNNANNDDTASPSTTVIVVPPPTSLPHIVSLWLDDNDVTSLLLPPPLMATTIQPPILQHLLSLPPLPSLLHINSHEVQQPREQSSPHPPIDPDRQATTMASDKPILHEHLPGGGI